MHSLGYWFQTPKWLPMRGLVKLLALVTLALVSKTSLAQDPAHRTWRLAGIYVGELTGAPGAPLATKNFFTLRSANAQGGNGDIEVVSNAGQVLFRQRFTWRFAQDISVLQSGGRLYDVQYGMEGEYSTRNGNLVHFGTGGNLYERYLPPQRAAAANLFSFEFPITSSNPPTNAVGVHKTGVPANATGNFRIPHSGQYDPAQWGRVWFHVQLSNNEPGGSQVWEIHYVFTSDRAPAGVLPGPGELPPGVTYLPPAGGTPPQPPPPQPPGHQPPPGTDGNFRNPQVNDVAVDWCARYGAGCGQESADQFCRSQGFARASRWSQVAVNRTVVLGDNRVCQAPNPCNALRDVVCVRDGAAGPPPPNRPGGGMSITPPPPSPPPPTRPGDAIHIPPSSAGRIQVLTGTYGANCGQPRGNKSQHLSSACNGRDSCEYVVDHRVIGDPAIGCRKSYVAEWQCAADGRTLQASAPPEATGSRIVLSCRN